MAGRDAYLNISMIKNFLLSDKVFMIVDWNMLGYSGFKNAYQCIRNNLQCYKCPCTCQMRNGKLYIVKAGYKLRKHGGQIYVTKIKGGK